MNLLRFLRAPRLVFFELAEQTPLGWLLFFGAVWGVERRVRVVPLLAVAFGWAALFP